MSAQQISIKGTVTDQSGEPLIGVSVTVPGTKIGAATDIDGNFGLTADAKAKLKFSYIGYLTIEEAVDGRSVINVVMKENSEVLSEVVVIGYGTMDKKELTSAISHVSEKDFLSVSSLDPSMMIQGKVPGVSITNTGAGDPNNQASIQIRGVSSRSAGLGPLIVIDGVPGGNLTNINPKDIATSYSGTFAWDKIVKELDMMNAQEYRDVRLGWGDRGVNLGGNIDWLDAVSRTGFTMQHTLTVSGGNERSNYRVSADYRDANGVDLRSNREEYGARASVMHTTKGGLFTISLNVAPRIIYRDNADWSVFRNAIEANPTTPLMDPENPNQYYNFQGQVVGSNPVELQKLEKNHSDTKLLDWDGTIKLNLLPLLSKNESANHNLSTQIMFADHQYSNNDSWFRPSTSTLAINNGRDGEASRAYSKNVNTW